MDAKYLKMFVDYPHTLGIALGYNKLTDIHSEWIVECWAKGKDIVLQAHRNSYKTTSVLIVGAIWYLLINPEATISIVRKADKGAEAILGAISRHYDTKLMRDLYKEIYKVELKKVSDKASQITLNTKKIVTKEGNIESMGIGGSITGQHYDKIMCDDIVTIKDRISKAERERTKSFVMELINIKKADGNITVTGTPWHKQDVFSILPEPIKYPYGSINISDLTDKEITEIKKRITPSLFAINYLLKHISDENKIFTEAKYCEWTDEASGIIAHIDAAYSGDHYTALTLAELWEGRLILLGYTWRKSIVDLYQEIAEILRQHNCGTCYMEDNADKGLGKIGLQRYYPNVAGYHEKENKHNKIIMHLKGNWDKVYFATECQDEYVNQVIDYEEGQLPDDCADSAACAIMRVIKQGDRLEASVKDEYKEYAY